MLGKAKAERFLHEIENSVAQYSSLSSNLSQVDEIRHHLQVWKTNTTSKRLFRRSREM